MPRILLILLLVLASGVARSQAKMVVGTITKKTNGKALKNVEVTLRGTLVGTKTNRNGEFIIRIPEGSSNTLVFKRRGYETNVVEVGDRIRIDLSMYKSIKSQAH